MRKYVNITLNDEEIEYIKNLLSYNWNITAMLIEKRLNDALEETKEREQQSA